MFAHPLNFSEVMRVNSVTTISKDLNMKDVEKLQPLSPIFLICTDSNIFQQIMWFDSKLTHNFVCVQLLLKLETKTRKVIKLRFDQFTTL